MPTEGTTWDSLVARVRRERGVSRAQMRELREAHGAKKLGTDVCDRIVRELRMRRILTIPRELPTNQDDWVILFAEIPRVRDLVKAITEPGHPSSADRLRSYAVDNAAAVLDQLEPAVDGIIGELKALLEHRHAPQFEMPESQESSQSEPDQGASDDS